MSRKLPVHPLREAKNWEVISLYLRPGTIRHGQAVMKGSFLCYQIFNDHREPDILSLLNGNVRIWPLVKKSKSGRYSNRRETVSHLNVSWTLGVQKTWIQWTNTKTTHRCHLNQAVFGLYELHLAVVCLKGPIFSWSLRHFEPHLLIVLPGRIQMWCRSHFVWIISYSKNIGETCPRSTEETRLLIV